MFYTEGTFFLTHPPLIHVHAHACMHVRTQTHTHIHTPLLLLLNYYKHSPSTKIQYYISEYNHKSSTCTTNILCYKTLHSRCQVLNKCCTQHISEVPHLSHATIKNMWNCTIHKQRTKCESISITDIQTLYNKRRSENLKRMCSEKSRWTQYFFSVGKFWFLTLLQF